jgi:hypothetical protein
MINNFLDWAQEQQNGEQPSFPDVTPVVVWLRL